ncbi:cytochrome P450 [Humibacillus xanthopallidus]|uniref:Cytochrome P450 n=1 Tax=Humibacillus xanthopallidus TaxID=412689 RepID=A0A543PT24_9MICO|nr:cytochrome P450 [Humibacillus xanthopallidus]TQN47233.1 cytochrome P450 [Humibacillus xanthopallidus]
MRAPALTRRPAATDVGRAWESRLIRSAHPVVARVVDLAVARRSVTRLPGVGLLVADPEAARRVLTDTEHFTKQGPGSSGALWTPVLGERVLLNMDGSEHALLRRSLADLFSPRVVDEVCREAAQPIVARAAEQLRAGEPVDVVRLAREVSAAVIGQVVGLSSDADLADLLRSSDDIESMVTWRTRTFDEAGVDHARRALAVVQDAAESAHRAAQADTVMGRLALQGVSLDEARSLAAALFLTGVGTVSSALPRIVGQLADAGFLDRPGAATADLDAVIAEGLRMTTPSLATLRRCARPTELNGIRPRQDERVVVLLWWATRLSGGFDPGRRAPVAMRHLWFGAGSHFCLGAPLALAELRAMTGMVLEVAAERGLVVTRRVAARRVLVPRYAELWVSAGAPG